MCSYVRTLEQRRGRGGATAAECLSEEPAATAATTTLVLTSFQVPHRRAAAKATQATLSYWE
eukprot:1113609-Pyramimonas_sp.AAC.1